MTEKVAAIYRKSPDDPIGCRSKAEAAAMKVHPLLVTCVLAMILDAAIAGLVLWSLRVDLGDLVFGVLKGLL